MEQIDWLHFGVMGVVTLLVFGTAANVAPIMIWVERRGAAFMQNRLGPNRVGPFGLFQSLADAVKFLFKEDVIPERAHPYLFMIAPALVVALAFLTLAAIPFGGEFFIQGKQYVFQIADIPIGLLYVLAVSSFAIYGILLGGWASNNKFALLGAMRASAQMVSYEIALGVGMATMILLYGSFDLREIISFQSTGIFSWGLWSAPLTFVVLLIAVFAETNRLPFDMAEGEAEIVGFHVEYASMKFALYFMAEYIHMFVGSAVLTCLFLGGWHLPGLNFSSLEQTLLGWGWQETMANLGVVFVQFNIMLAKISIFLWLFVWVRWSFPRFRYDHLMIFGWKFLIPLSLVSLVITTVIVYFRDVL
jgi:NADH-quinone oxidoreductase subunit H